MYVSLIAGLLGPGAAAMSQIGGELERDIPYL